MTPETPLSSDTPEQAAPPAPEPRAGRCAVRRGEGPFFILPATAALEPLVPERLFGAVAPLEVDVGCGKGRFLIARATRFPGTHFFGIDRMLKRLRKVDRKARAAGLTNVRLLRLEASYVMERMLPDACVSAFYFFFPDPWPKRRHHVRRLFQPAFRDSLHRCLTPDGVLHVATDYRDYAESIRKGFQTDPRFEPAPVFEPAPDERTNFELVFAALGRPTHRCAYRKRADAAQSHQQGQG